LVAVYSFEMQIISHLISGRSTAVCIAQFELGVVWLNLASLSLFWIRLLRLFGLLHVFRSYSIYSEGQTVNSSSIFYEIAYCKHFPRLFCFVCMLVNFELHAVHNFKVFSAMAYKAMKTVEKQKAEANTEDACTISAGESRVKHRRL
jgi:hypothetical protein